MQVAKKQRPVDLPVRHRRRPPFLNPIDPPAPPRSTAPLPSRGTTAFRALVVLFPLALVAYAISKLLHRSPSPVTPLPAADDEVAVSAFRIPLPSPANTAPAHGVFTCMPTVTRANGSVEYISNAAKSWYLAHAGLPPPLRVYDMDPIPSDRSWLKRLGSPDPWLRVIRLEGTTKAARKRTFGDSVERVKWRSKEAQDYAAVLRDCAASAVLVNSSASVVLMVQDDVLFTNEMPNAAEGAAEALRDGARTKVNKQGVNAPLRVCSASLFDIGGQGEEYLSSSNLVARVWRIEDVERIAAYFERRFDDAPVDWLADRWCERHRSVVVVLRPNPVRHRGLVSSFVENERKGTLT